MPERIAQLNARLGMDLFGADVALANNSALTGLNRWLWTDLTLRPRTIGCWLLIATDMGEQRGRPMMGPVGSPAGGPGRRN